LVLFERSARGKRAPAGVANGLGERGRHGLQNLGGFVKPALQVAAQRRQAFEKPSCRGPQPLALAVVQLIEMVSIPGAVRDETLRCPYVSRPERAGCQPNRQIAGKLPAVVLLEDDERRG
jgi:hypothetical protein